MMTCRELVELLIDFLDGDLPEERRRILETHLSLCEPCLKYLETYKVTIKLTRRLPDVPLPPGLLQKLEAALCEEMRTRNQTDKEVGRTGDKEAE
jgi:anti-sigma factor RsiW